MNSADAVSWPSILDWYMHIPTACSVYTVWGDKPLSSALWVCDCSLIAVHILSLWTQTEFSRCTYVTAKRFVFQRGDAKSSARRMERFLTSTGFSHVSVWYGVQTRAKVRLANSWTWIKLARRGSSGFKMNSRALVQSFTPLTWVRSARLVVLSSRKAVNLAIQQLHSGFDRVQRTPISFESIESLSKGLARTQRLNLRDPSGQQVNSH